MNFDNLKTFDVGYKIVVTPFIDKERTRQAQAEFKKSKKSFKGLKKFLCKFIPGCTAEDEVEKDPPIIYKDKYTIDRVYLWGKFLEPENNVNSEKFPWKFIVSDRIEVHKGVFYPTSVYKASQVFLTLTEAQAEWMKIVNENSADN